MILFCHHLFSYVTGRELVVQSSIHQLIWHNPFISHAKVLVKTDNQVVKETQVKIPSPGRYFLGDVSVFD